MTEQEARDARDALIAAYEAQWQDLEEDKQEINEPTQPPACGT